MKYTNRLKTLGQSFVKALASVCLILAPALVLAPAAHANNGPDGMYAVFNQQGVSAIKLGGTVATATGNGSAASTTTVMMELFYNGTATAAYVSIGASSMTFYAPYNVVDTSIGTGASIYTAGTFDLAAATMSSAGQLCDAVNTQSVTNGKSNYHCTLVGAVRSDVIDNYLPNFAEASGVNNLKAVGGYNVPTSTGVILSLGIIPQPNRHVVLNYCTVNAGGTPTFQVYGVPAKFSAGLDQFGNALNDSNLAWQGPALVTNTTTNEPLATIVAQPWIEFGPLAGNGYSYTNAPIANQYNGHVVVRAGYYLSNNVAIAGTTSNFLSCNWLEKGL